MSTVKLSVVSKQLEALSDEERRALRGSKFASSDVSQISRERQPRLAHPGGALATNKAAALCKFLKRKLNEPAGVSALDPALVDLAVKNAEETLSCGASSRLNVQLRHVETFSDTEQEFADQIMGNKSRSGDCQNQNLQAKAVRNSLKQKNKKQNKKKKKGPSAGKQACTK